jgi:hypothetical protein
VVALELVVAVAALGDQRAPSIATTAIAAATTARLPRILVNVIVDLFRLSSVEKPMIQPGVPKMSTLTLKNSAAGGYGLDRCGLAGAGPDQGCRPDQRAEGIEAGGQHLELPHVSEQGMTGQALPDERK